MLLTHALNFQCQVDRLLDLGFIMMLYQGQDIGHFPITTRAF